MTAHVADMPWLPPPPSDFRSLCREIDATPDGAGVALQHLAGHALDGNQLMRLGRSVRPGMDLRPLAPVKLGLLSNATTELTADALIGAALRHGVALEVVAAPFDQAVQQALDPGSAINTTRPQVVLLALDYRGVPLDQGIEAAIDHLVSLRDAIVAHCGATVIFQSIARPPETLFGGFDAVHAPSLRRRIDGVNARLAEIVEQGSDLLLDVAGLAETVGLAQWHDPVQWFTAKLAFSQNLVPLYADHVGRLLGALRGRSRKCLVLDLDNTLWGGEIGDDGLDGIVLGNGDPQGEAFLAVQKMAAEYRRRGIVLAVCSKNDEANARLPFQRHPEMLLKEDDISVFQANWTDKASNLETIAAELDFGLDALVLLDDNPAERAQVRGELPQVAVPELPDDPALFPRVLQSAGYFEAIAFSEEDRNRAEQYRAGVQRATLKAGLRDLTTYLESLEMVLGVAPFDAASRPRVTQLINKSNQFNLTTRRYTENEVEALESDPSVIGLHGRLADRFGDNGIISVVICRDRGAEWELDTWLMSCRVLGRGVEQAILNELARQAIARDKVALTGVFIDSGRNGLVRDHYEKLGFARTGARTGGDATRTEWRLALDGYQPREANMTVETSR